jgi:propanol-preferring alcohol dehydrogenase
MSTYRAVHVTSPGKFELVNRPLLDPPAGKVRIRVEACGICHSDSVTVDSLLTGNTYPRVPGHFRFPHSRRDGRDIANEAA